MVRRSRRLNAEEEAPVASRTRSASADGRSRPGTSPSPAPSPTARSRTSKRQREVESEVSLASKAKKSRVSSSAKGSLLGSIKVQNRNKEKKESTTFVDPITLQPFKTRNAFVFKRENGTEVKFDPIALAKYILSSGDFTDPLTRIRFKAKDLKRLDTVVSKCEGKVESVYKAFQNKSHYDDLRTNRDAVVGLERCIGELVAEMLDILERLASGALPPDEAGEDLLGNLLPSFRASFELFAQADPEYARQSLDQYCRFIQGPPNRRTPNISGFLTIVLSAFRLCKHLCFPPLESQTTAATGFTHSSSSSSSSSSST